MKCFEKKMSGFTIIYLHDPTTCTNCTQMEKFGETRAHANKFLVPRKKIARKKKNFINVPFVDTVTESKSSDESDFEFPKPFDNYGVYPVKPFKKIKVFKKKNFSSNLETFQASSKESLKKSNTEYAKKSNVTKSVKKSKIRETNPSTSGKKQCSSSDKNKSKSMML